jgi:ATP-dependent DNA helicase RecG
MASSVRRKSTASASSKGAAVSAPDQALAKLGLVRDIDLALHLPLRYEDETRVVAIASLHDGETGQVEGVVSDSRIQFRPRRQLVVKIADDSGDLVLRFLHFYPSQQKMLAVGKRVRVRGEARGGFFGLEMVHPSFKVVTAETPLPTALTPVYPSTVQLSQAYLRKAVGAGRARADLDEHLPAGTVPDGLPTLRAALAHLHEPLPGLDAAALEDREHPAWQRLKFDELLAQQLSQLLAKRERERQRAPPLVVSHGRLHDALREALPFALTAAQRRVAEEIDADLGRTVPMHRLLQGDVGSGKTVVAALAAARAIDTGWQCALMAPTEILAEQHLKKLVGWLAPLGITVAWLTGSRKGKKRDEMLAQVASGEAGLVVGTHAVIEEQVRFARLGLAIIDEQHRFGVAQRLALREKLHDQGELEPHLLMMSATPIPRTLAMTVFADLDVSTIDELPPGRTPVVTKLFVDTRRAVRSLAGQADRAAARPHAGGREGGGDVALRRRPDRGAGRDDGDRGRRRRRQCITDGGRARRALRPVAAAPAARPGRPRHDRERLRAALQRAALRHRQGAAESDARDRRRLRDLAPRSGDPWPGRVSRCTPVGCGAAALRRPDARRGTGRRRASRRRAAARRSPASGRAPHRALARRPRALPERLASMLAARFIQRITDEVQRCPMPLPVPSA